MTDFTIVEAKAWHCGQMVRALRLDHHHAVMRLGIDAHRNLRDLFDDSTYRRAWMIDGKLAALGGVSGPAIAATGFIWLTLTESALKYPLAIVKEARRQLAIIMQTKHELATTVLGEDAAALRLAIFLGFHVAHEGRGQPAFSRQGRRNFLQYLEDEPKHRIEVPRGYVIPMGYHLEGEAA